MLHGFNVTLTFPQCNSLYVKRRSVRVLFCIKAFSIAVLNVSLLPVFTCRQYIVSFITNILQRIQG